MFTLWMTFYYFMKASKAGCTLWKSSDSDTDFSSCTTRLEMALTFSHIMYCLSCSLHGDTWSTMTRPAAPNWLDGFQECLLFWSFDSTYSQDESRAPSGVLHFEAFTLFNCQMMSLIIGPQRLGPPKETPKILEGSFAHETIEINVDYWQQSITF